LALNKIKTIPGALAFASQLATDKRYVESENILRQIVGQIPDLPEANHGLGIICHYLNKTDEAIYFLEKAIALLPDNLTFHLDMAGVLRLSYRPDRALVEIEKVLSLDPMNQKAMVERGYCYWLKGDLPAAFASTKLYREAHSSNFRSFPRPQWKGEPLEGKTILIYAEQGLGDAIFFLRFIPIIAGRGAKVLLMLHSPLHRLAENLPGVTQLFDAQNKLLPDFDFHIPLLELPGHLGTNIHTFPDNIPYLAPDPGDVVIWKARLGPKKGLRIGLVWACNPEQTAAIHRSMPISALAPLVGIPGVEYFSVQKGPASVETANAPSGLALRDETSRLKDMADTAAFVRNLDLVISIDTSTVHLCGALNVPCWMPLSAHAHHIYYLMEREDCPWYPSLRIFRQTQPNDWEPVMAKIAKELTYLTKGD
jgi:hypothetical protein